MQPEELQQPAPQRLLGVGSDVTPAATQEGVRFVRVVSWQRVMSIWQLDQVNTSPLLLHHNYAHVALVTEDQTFFHLI